MVKSIPGGNISGVFYFSLFINLYKHLQSTLNMYINMHMGKMYTLKRKGLDPETEGRKVKNIFVFFFHVVRYWNFSLLFILLYFSSSNHVLWKQCLCTIKWIFLFHGDVNIRYNCRISSVANSHTLHLFHSCPLGSDFLSYPWIILFQIHHSQLLIWWSTESFFNHFFLLTMHTRLRNSTLSSQEICFGTVLL